MIISFVIAQELKAATEDFADDCLLGKGSHGLVYRGVLKDGKEVAVKRATYARQLLQDESSFDNELEILSKIWSDKLVNLIGYTREQDEKLLVVEFMSNGTLHDNLHDNSFPLSWTMRIHLALQTAKGILSLHRASPPIIHRDIKSSNVLIDEHWNAKLGDFGLALRGHIEDMVNTSTPPAGTMGYLDPEYETPSDLSTKTDVFSFGILLLEIISGRNAIDLVYEPPSILDWALPLIKQGRMSEVLDKKVPVSGNMKPIKQMINLAIKCARTSRQRRPSMLEVVEELKDTYRKVSVPSFDGISRAVRRGMTSQRPGWPGASARRAMASSQSNHRRLLSQVTERLSERQAKVADSDPLETTLNPEPSLPEGDSSQTCEGNPVTTQDAPRHSSRASTSYYTDCISEVEVEVESEPEPALDDFKSACASFRSSSASASIDMDEEILCEDDAFKSHPVKARSRVSKPLTTPLSPCISPGVSHELGMLTEPGSCTVLGAAAASEGGITEEDFATVEVRGDLFCELTQIQDLIISQNDLVEHPVSRSSSRSGSGSVRSYQARLLELQNAQLKAINEVFSAKPPAGASSDRVPFRLSNTRESEVFSVPTEDTTGVGSRRTPYLVFKTLATTCLGATVRPCVRLKEEDELTTRPYIVGT